MPKIDFTIPEGVLQAEKQFHKLLPHLLNQHCGKWVYVSSDCRYEVFDTQDEADIGAEDKSLPKDSFVVRIVLPCEQPDD